MLAQARQEAEGLLERETFLRCDLLLSLRCSRPARWSIGSNGLCMCSWMTYACAACWIVAHKRQLQVLVAAAPARIRQAQGALASLSSFVSVTNVVAASTPLQHTPPAPARCLFPAWTGTGEGVVRVKPHHCFRMLLLLQLAALCSLHDSTHARGVHLIWLLLTQLQRVRLSRDSLCRTPQESTPAKHTTTPRMYLHQPTTLTNTRCCRCCCHMSW